MQLRNNRLQIKSIFQRHRRLNIKDLISKGMIDKAIKLKPVIEAVKRDIQSLVNAKNVLLAVDNNNHLNKLLKAVKKADIKAIQKFPFFNVIFLE